jgi:hypothetical protein
MNLALSTPSVALSLARHRTAIALAALFLSLLLAVTATSAWSGLIRPFGAPAAPLGKAIERTIRSEGIVAGLTQYQALRQEGFRGYRESEDATNSLAYRLLAKGKASDAVQVLEANARTHPGSANAHDSLGEALLAAGRTQDAIASYQRALAIDPEFKSSAIALQKLTGMPRKPLPPAILLHIAAGICALAFGVAAMIGRKGGRIHRVAGDGFVVAMMLMAGLGAAIGLLKSQPANVLAGAFTFYLVVTGWWTARQRQGRLGPPNGLAVCVAWVICVAFLSEGLRAIADDANAGPYVLFGVISLIAASGDLRALVAGAPAGAALLVRHLWRMGLAMFIATSSFFLGQTQVFPERAQTAALLGIPSLLIVIFLVYWLGRSWRRRGAQAPALPPAAVVH